MPTALEKHEAVIKTPGSPSHARRASLKVLNRNIDNVVLGNLEFPTWYFSPYPESVIFGPDYHAPRPSLNGDHKPSVHHEPPVIPTLHVCPYCFCYSVSVQDYAQHIQFHVRDAESDPEDWMPVPKTAEKIYEWEGHTVWDIDGEREKLYCQNLSLFGKLFLEQKSVFFDTSGFHYFVLTYHPPLKSEASKSATATSRGRRRASSGQNADLGMKTQVLGFFSKENLSWDANNLACILVFPPYQHRSLGQLLMAVSYKLSGWEWEDSIIGGPEKPLSAMGRKSYLRFWSERIARFFMGQTADADGKKVFSGTRKKRSTFTKEEMTIAEIGDRTGILAEDVSSALSSMAITEIMSSKRKKKSSEAQATQQDQESPLTAMLIKRSQVLEWAQRNHIDLVNPVKEEGFRGEWALSDTSDDHSHDSEHEESTTS